jgi:hypothetical protein
MWRFRLSDEDREKYGGPEWVEYALSKAVDLEVDLLEQVEDATGYTILVGLPEALGRGSLRATRAAVWLARHIAGVHEPGFAQFKPNMLAAAFEWVDDVDPPAPEPPNRAARRASRTSTKRTAPRSGT